MKAILVDKKLFTKEYEIDKVEDYLAIPLHSDISMELYNSNVRLQPVRVVNFRLEKFISNVYDESIAVYTEV